MKAHNADATRNHLHPPPPLSESRPPRKAESCRSSVPGPLAVKCGCVTLPWPVDIKGEGLLGLLKNASHCGENELHQENIASSSFLVWTSYSHLGVILSPMGHLAMSGGIFGCHTLVGSVQLAACGWRAGRLLNILQCVGQAMLPPDKG